MSGTPPTRFVLGTAALVMLACACKRDGNATSSASAAPTPSPAAPAAPAVAQTKPWYSGGFSGKYQATLAPVEVKVGAVREWLKDDGAAASGTGQLNLQIDDAGLVVGSCDGPLGKSEATGKVEDNTLRVQLSATDDSAFGGVLVASRDGDGFKGTLSASSPDSLKVRKAMVELAKLPN